jgi:hypothetical protein
MKSNKAGWTSSIMTRDFQAVTVMVKRKSNSRSYLRKDFGQILTVKRVF